MLRVRTAYGTTLWTRPIHHTEGARPRYAEASRGRTARETHDRLTHPALRAEVQRGSTLTQAVARHCHGRRKSPERYAPVPKRSGEGGSGRAAGSPFTTVRRGTRYGLPQPHRVGADYSGSRDLHKSRREAHGNHMAVALFHVHARLNPRVVSRRTDDDAVGASTLSGPEELTPEDLHGLSKRGLDPVSLRPLRHPRSTNRVYGAHVNTVHEFGRAVLPNDVTCGEADEEQKRGRHATKSPWVFPLRVHGS